MGDFAITWACDSCGEENWYNPRTGGQYPYTDRVRYDGLMCKKCFRYLVELCVA